MEEKRNFKPLIGQNSKKLSNTGEALPIGKSLLDIGLTEANGKGEANITKAVKDNKRKPKATGRPLRERNRSFYPNHRFIEISNKVYIVLKPDSKVDMANFADFIHATEDPDCSKDIVDILPPLTDLHFKLIADPLTRIMNGDKVRVNFKFRSMNDLQAIKEKEYTTVKKVRFVCLGDMTAVVVDLDNGGYYPLNQLDLYDTNRP